VKSLFAFLHYFRQSIKASFLQDGRDFLSIHETRDEHVSQRGEAP
jgi:hypothetical protein